jgi:hypothetical protein
LIQQPRFPPPLLPPAGFETGFGGLLAPVMPLFICAAVRSRPAVVPEPNWPPPVRACVFGLVRVFVVFSDVLDFGNAVFTPID